MEPAINSSDTTPAGGDDLTAFPCFARFQRLLRAASFATILFLGAAVAPAAQLFVHVPGITGEQSTPGFPGVMAVQSLNIMPGQFSIVKPLDSASPQIVSAVAQGTLFPSASALLYNSAPTGPPTATLNFQNVVATSYQLQGGGTLERDGFVATNPGSLFLELPGITGESSTPGHPGVIQIDSFSLTANQFSIIKAIDSASPDIVLAVTNGTLFPTASAFFYNSATPAGPPDAIFVFGDVVASSYQVAGSPEVPKEEVSFNFASVVPDPGSSALLLCVGLGFVAAQRKVITHAR